MRNVTFSLAALLLILAASATDLRAQRFAVELRGAGAVPAQELAGTDLDPGFGFGGTAAYRLLPHLLVYGGWDWLHFRADQSFAGGDRDFEETGYSFGLRFEHPFTDASRLLYRLESGGTYRHVEIENTDGDLIADSGHDLGFEAGAGIVVPLGESWRLSPVVRYRSLSPEFTIDDVVTTGELRSVAFELGVAYQFPRRASTRTASPLMR